MDKQQTRALQATLRGVGRFSLVIDPVSQALASLPAVAEGDTQLLALWLANRPAHTQRAYIREIARFYEQVGKPLAQVRLEDIYDYMASLLDLKPASQKRAIAVVKSVCSFAAKMNYIPVNVGSMVKLPQLEDRLAERIMGEQAVAKMFALESSLRNHAILVLLYRAGLRVSELCGLEWRHLQERGEVGQVSIFGKGKKTRQVLLDQDTWEEVTILRSEQTVLDAPVFCSRQGGRLDTSSVYRIVAAAARRAGIKANVSPHWMRHAHATHALERGAPISLVKDTLGHKSLETTAKYTHARPNASSTQYLNI